MAGNSWTSTEPSPEVSAGAGAGTQWASIDLVAATRRQQSFMRQVLQHRHHLCTVSAMATSVQLYHKFLKLMRHSAALVPTLAIDLIWHTHMQFPVRYAIDCVAIVGHQVDHDDDDE